MRYFRKGVMLLFSVSLAASAARPAETIVRAGQTFVFSPRYQYEDTARRFSGSQ